MLPSHCLDYHLSQQHVNSQCCQLCRPHDICLLRLDLTLTKRHQNQVSNDIPVSSHAHATEVECLQVLGHTLSNVVCCCDTSTFSTSVTRVALLMCVLLP